MDFGEYTSVKSKCGKKLKELFETQKQNLNCVICTRMFRDPHTFPCSHTFCKKCIKQYYGTNYKKKCPLCNQEYKYVCLCALYLFEFI